MSRVRRRQRSARIVVVSIVLTIACLFVSAALAIASIELLMGAAVSAAVAGVVSARILGTELAQTRREWARDRAEQAAAYREVTRERIEENAELIETMTERLAGRDRKIRELDGTLRLVEARATQAEQKAVTLQQTVDQLVADNGDLVAQVTWDGADVPTIVDLLAWEAGAAAARQVADPDSDRKHA